MPVAAFRQTVSHASEPHPWVPESVRMASMCGGDATSQCGGRKPPTESAVCCSRPPCPSHAHPGAHGHRWLARRERAAWRSSIRQLQPTDMLACSMPWSDRQRFMALACDALRHVRCPPAFECMQGTCTRQYKQAETSGNNRRTRTCVNGPSSKARVLEPRAA